MFNGIIYKNGSVHSMQKKNKAAQLSIKTNLKFKNSEIGSSVCCNGTCLTITKIKNNFINFYLSKETLKKTNYNYIKIGDIVNLEKSLNYGNKISGHYVQGHVDTIAQVIKINKLNNNWEVNFKIPRFYKKYLIEKGSVAINGVSLTISKVKKSHFEICVIPHTLRLTNLEDMKINKIVNVELDIFTKYILKISQ